MSSKIKLTGDEMRFIAVFESVSGVVAKDCVIDGKVNRVIFVVEPGNTGLAVGKQGAHVKMLRRMIGKDIEVVEYDADLAVFIKNSFTPAQVKEVRITEKPDGKKMAVAVIDPRDKGIAIGKNGKNAEKIRFLAKRYFNVDNLVIK